MAERSGCGVAGAGLAAPTSPPRPSLRGTPGQQCDPCVAGPGPREAENRAEQLQWCPGESQGNRAHKEGHDLPQVLWRGLWEPHRCRGAKLLPSVQPG